MAERALLGESPISRFFRGLAYPFDGLRYIQRHSLWGLASVSIGINVLLFVGLIAGAWLLVAPWVADLNQLLSAWAGGFETEIVIWLAVGLVWIIWILTAVLALGASSLVLLLLGQAVASPFLDMLSERVENIEIGTPEQPFTVAVIARSLALSFSDLFWGLLFLAAVHIPIFIVSLIPGVGTVPASIASFVFSALLLAVEFVGLSMTRRFVSYRGRWGAIWANKGLSLGFGTSSMLLLLVPGLNLILLPLAAVGGTLAFCDLERNGDLVEFERLAA